MSVLDFLFEGKPAPAVGTYSQSVQGLPQWLSDYSQGILTQANAVGNMPYQPYQGQRIAGLNDDQLKAMQMVRDQSGQAGTTIGGAISAPGGLQTAAPYLAGANKTFTGDTVGQYMNPYITNVTDRAAQLTNRALNEQLLPSLERTFGGAGGQDPRSSAYLREADRGTRDLAEGLQSQNLAALAQGYTSGGEQFSSDTARQAQLASTAGNFAGLDRTQLANLANAQQAANLTDVGALGTVGQTIQGQQQKNLDTAYQDFLTQRGYPQSQLNWMASLPKQLPTPGYTDTTGAAPGTAFQPSGLSQLGSIATGTAGLLKSLGDLGIFSGSQNTQPVTDPAGAVKRGGFIRKSRFNTGGYLRYAHAA